MSNEARTILVPTDLTERGNKAVTFALGILRCSAGTLHLFHIIKLEPLPNPLYSHYAPGHYPSSEERERLRLDAEARLQTLVPSGAPNNILVEVWVREDTGIAHAIAKMAHEVHADTICMAREVSGLKELLLGSVAVEVLEEVSKTGERLQVVEVLEPPSHRREPDGRVNA